MPRHRLLPALCLSLLLAAGCYTHRPVTERLEEALARPRTVRVTRSGGATFVIEAACLVGDSLVGSCTRSSGRSPRVAVSLADLRRVETHDLAWDSTVLAVLLIGSAVTFAVLGIVYSNMGFGGFNN